MSASRHSGTLAEDLAALQAEAPELIAFLSREWLIWARHDQLPPQTVAEAPAWRTWVILGGRGAGKTRAGAEWIRAQALGVPPLAATRAQRIALIGETFADVRRVMIEGVSGLMAVHGGDERPHFEASKHQLVWPNGTIAQCFSAMEPDGLRGPQFDCAWCDELAKVAGTGTDVGYAAVRLAAW